MANLDYSGLLCELWGWPNECAANPFAGFSNIVVGTNPAYSSADFLALYPQFGAADPTSDGPIPQPVLDAYIAYASACLVQARWLEGWKIGMGLFIAHYCTMWASAAGGRAQPNLRQIAAFGIAQGIRIGESAAGVSGQYQAPELPEWGAWNLTAFGQIFATMAKVIGSGPMLVY